jgi:hypothetical protein
VDGVEVFENDFLAFAAVKKYIWDGEKPFAADKNERKA